MRGDLGLKGQNFKSEGFYTVWVSFPYTKLNSAGNFVWVADLKLLHYSLRNLAGDDCAEHEDFLLDEKDIGVDQVGDVLFAPHASHNHLLFENGLKVVSVDPWNATLSQQFVENASWLIFVGPVHDVDGKFLLIKLLALTDEDYFDGQ